MAKKEFVLPTCEKCSNDCKKTTSAEMIGAFEKGDAKLYCKNYTTKNSKKETTSKSKKEE